MSHDEMTKEEIWDLPVVFLAIRTGVTASKQPTDLCMIK